MSLLNTFVRPGDVRSMLRQNKSYTLNRDRVGAMVHDGLAALEVYEKWRPVLFFAGLVGAIGSGYTLYRRRQRGGEAWGMWGTSTALCATVAWITRPGPRPGSPGAPPSTPEAPGVGFLGYVDRRVAKLRDTEGRDFADHSLQRMVDLPSIAPSWSQADPLLKAVVV